MKFLNMGKFFFLLMFVLCLGAFAINEIEIASAKSWCWTKPVINDPSFILNPSNGGTNWGFCKLGNSGSNKKKEYYVYISTSSLPQSEASSTIYISLRGTESTSKEIILSNNGFKAGSYERVKIFSEDVGNLQAIKLINKGRQQWRCNTVKIESEMNYWNFECDKPLKFPNNMVELSVVNMITYDITVKTSSMDDSGTTMPIYIVIWGTIGKSPQKLLSDKGFKEGSLVQASIDTVDVGNIYGITLYLNGNDNWRPEEIIVKKAGSTGGTMDKIFKNIKNTPIISWDKSLTLKLAKPDSDSDEDDPGSSTASSTSLLDAKDQEKVIKLSCTDILKDNENFGPNFVTSNVNYMNFLADCPSDCMRSQIRAIGMGIHPEESPVCINALVDRALSFYGGTISVNIYKGLESYTGGKKLFNIPIQGYGKSKRSYSVSKVDNVDMIAKDVRILDAEGKTSYKGRVEIRSEGVWGTICAVGLDNSAARIICKQIGYKQGQFLNPNETKGRGFCANYEGLNYCGAQAGWILFSHLNCQGNEESIMDCYRKTADKTFCTHQYDTLIECANTSIEEYVSFEANTLRLIDSTGNPTQTGIGRLEILRGSWGTICNTKFTNKSAAVSCKQMGYLDGRVYGQTDSNNMCANVLGNNLCGDFSQPIKLTEIVCFGHEKSIKDCKTNDSTVSCTHFNDVIVKCEGYGDSSGRSQNNQKPKVLDPLIEKLPMPPTYNAKCDSTAKNIHFRGDPGSVFLVNCPSDCARSNFSVTGTGVYSIDSSICRSALQSGVITNEGGNVALTKTYGQNKYYSTTLRGISSLESNYLKVSFFLSAPNSAYTNMISMINNGSFLELSYQTDYALLPITYSSFLETTMWGPEIKAVYDWTAPNNAFKFEATSATYVDLFSIESARKILEMKTFTVFTKIIMHSFNNIPQTIFSIGGCDGFSIVIDSNDELMFDVKCGTISYKSGIYIPVNYETNISVVYDGSKIIYYLDGVKYNEVATYFNLHYKDKIMLGKSSEYEADYFNGKIFFIAFFSEALGPKRNYKIFRYGYTKPEKNKEMKLITLDNRLCISSCANQPTPGVPGSPSPPTEAITYEINGDKTILPGTFAGNRRDSKGQVDLNPFIEVKCTATAREIFKGEIKIGDKIRIKCPGDCIKPKGLIYGTIIYSFDSLACFSAIHAGVIKGNEASMILIKALPGMTFYQGSKQYNIQSTSIDKSDYSFSVEVAPPVIQIDCKTTSGVPQFASTIGMKFLVKCPEKCSKIPHNVFGDVVYSGDSSICQAAIHSGSLNDRGGEVQFIIEPGKKLYFGKRVFGIESKERDSYVKSIRFFNSNSSLYVKYTETFKEPTVTVNWDIVDDLEANNYPSKWEYVPKPANIRATSNFLLRQSNRIKSDSTLNYGSVLLLKNADVVNSLYKTSFYFINLSPVGIVFRYKDENNYYHVRINNLGSFKIVLIKRFEGKSTVLSSSQISIIPRLWYTFTLLIYYEKFQVFLQVGDLRNNQLIFETIDNDIQRGSVGIGTEGNDDFYVNGIYVDNYEMSKDHSSNRNAFDTRSFELLLRDNNRLSKEKYCKSLNENNINGIQYCKEYHHYCSLRCNELVHRRENILNYYCSRLCVKDYLMKEKIKNMQMTQEVAFGINPDVWSPKEKDKCDYKPDDEGSSSSWVPCYVTAVNNNPNDPEQKTLQIKYTSGDSVKITSILYPNTTIKHCGIMIKSRKDCTKATNELPTLNNEEENY